MKVRWEFWTRHKSRMGDFLNIFNSLNPLKFFTKHCKTHRNFAKPVSISKITPVKFPSCQIHL